MSVNSAARARKVLADLMADPVRRAEIIAKRSASRRAKAKKWDWTPMSPEQARADIARCIREQPMDQQAIREYLDRIDRRDQARKASRG
jgi:hypothetical protein